MIKKLKAVYNKEDSDHSSGNVDPFEYHKTFYYLLRAFLFLNDEKKITKQILHQNTVIFTVTLVLLILLSISCQHAVQARDIVLMTEVGVYLITGVYEILILSCAKRNLPQYRFLLQAIKNDFAYICTDGEKYRERYFNNQLKTWKKTLLACVMVAIVSGSMVVFAVVQLLYYLATNSDEAKQRPMPYPLWLYDVNLSSSPTYEILFSFFSLGAILCGYNYTFLMQTQIVWILHIASKVDIIIWSIEELLNDVHLTNNLEEKKQFWKILQNRLKEIVIHHQSMNDLVDNYAIVYKKLHMFEQKFFGPIACLCAYCSAKKLEDGEVHLTLISYTFGISSLYFVNNFCCTYLGTKVSSISDACWDIPFWNADTRIRPYMILIMQRSLRPLPLKAAGFDEFSLLTFSRRMAAAYSTFNMLRQLNV